MKKILVFILILFFSLNVFASENTYASKDYFDYSSVLEDFPKNYYYTTVKINKSKERILIITDRVNSDKTACNGYFYYFAKNGFVYFVGHFGGDKPFTLSKNYIYTNVRNQNIKFYVSDKKFMIEKSSAKKSEQTHDMIFDTIGSADKFAGDFGSPAGNDIKKVTVDGFYFEYHKPQYKRKFIKNLMLTCIKDGVKTQVQMYCCVVKKIHP